MIDQTAYSLSVINSSPTLSEMGLNAKGKPLNPGESRSGSPGEVGSEGGFFSKLGKLVGGGSSVPQIQPTEDKLVSFVEALKKRGVAQNLIMDALQEAR